MDRTGRDKAIAVGLWLNAALLLALLLVLLGRTESSSLLPAAIGQVPATNAAAAPGPLQIVPAQLASGHWGCYVLDLETRRVAVYQYQPGDRQFRLIAVRDIRNDLRLSEFNTTPSPQEVSRLVEERQQPAR